MHEPSFKAKTTLSPFFTRISGQLWYKFRRIEAVMAKRLQNRKYKRNVCSLLRSYGDFLPPNMGFELSEPVNQIYSDSLRCFVIGQHVCRNLF